MSRPVRPSSAKANAEAAREAARLEESAPVRLVIEISPSARRTLRMRAAESGLTIRDFVLRALARDGVE